MTATALDLFQIATCQIAADCRGDAAMTLTIAIRKIESDGVDRDLRADLVGLCKSLIAKVSS